MFIRAASAAFLTFLVLGTPACGGGGDPPGPQPQAAPASCTDATANAVAITGDAAAPRSCASAKG